MSEELFNGSKDEYFEGYVNQKSGSFGDLPAYYWCTGYLRVNEGDIVIFPMKAPSSLGACYDENKKYVKGISSSDLDDELKYTIQIGISYIRISIEKGRVSNDISKFILKVIYKNSSIEDDNKDECDNICSRIENLEKRLEIIVLTSEEYTNLSNSGQLEDKLYFII